MAGMLKLVQGRESIGELGQGRRAGELAAKIAQQRSSGAIPDAQQPVAASRDDPIPEQRQGIEKLPVDRMHVAGAVIVNDYSARDIQIRTTPAPCHDGETVYFTVPTGSDAQPVLQVTFEPDYQPAREELSLLKAAASVAAVVLQYGDPRSLVACNAW